MYQKLSNFLVVLLDALLLLELRLESESETRLSKIQDKILSHLVTLNPGMR